MDGDENFNGIAIFSEIVSVLLRGVANMEESTTYQEIIEKGMERGLASGTTRRARAILLRRASVCPVATMRGA